MLSGDERHRRASDPRPSRVARPPPAPVFRGTRCLADVVSPTARVGRGQWAGLRGTSSCPRVGPVHLGDRGRCRASARLWPPRSRPNLHGPPRPPGGARSLVEAPGRPGPVVRARGSFPAATRCWTHSPVPLPGRTTGPVPCSWADRSGRRTRWPTPLPRQTNQHVPLDERAVRVTDPLAPGVGAPEPTPTPAPPAASALLIAEFTDPSPAADEAPLEPALPPVTAILTAEALVVGPAT